MSPISTSSCAAGMRARVAAQYFWASHLVHAVRLERTIALRMERPEERLSAVASCYSRSATTSYVLQPLAASWYGDSVPCA